MSKRWVASKKKQAVDIQRKLSQNDQKSIQPAGNRLLRNCKDIKNGLGKLLLA